MREVQLCPWKLLRSAIYVTLFHWYPTIIRKPLVVLESRWPEINFTPRPVDVPGRRYEGIGWLLNWVNCEGFSWVNVNTKELNMLIEISGKECLIFVLSILGSSSFCLTCLLSKFVLNTDTGEWLKSLEVFDNFGLSSATHSCYFLDVLQWSTARTLGVAAMANIRARYRNRTLSFCIYSVNLGAIVLGSITHTNVWLYVVLAANMDAVMPGVWPSSDQQRKIAKVWTTKVRARHS